jgi:ribonuclease BN (tRNA processing enzyme)
MSAEFDFREYDGQPIRLGPFTITATRVVHPVPAYGLRVEADGRVLAYSGDTGPCTELVELARDADLLLAEAAFQEGVLNPTDLHLTGVDAGRAASKAEVGRLLLTHIPPWNDREVALAEARTTFDGSVELARCDARYDV